MASDELAPGSRFSSVAFIHVHLHALNKMFAELLLGAKHCSVQGKGMLSVFGQQVSRIQRCGWMTTEYCKLEIEVFSRSP